MINSSISVLMPVYNEDDFIKLSIKAVLGQKYSWKYTELLVIDGISTDNTRGIVVSEMMNHPDFNIKLVDNPGRIVSTGMNIALRQAKGDVVIRVDGHCIIAPDYIQRCVEHLLKDGVDGVGGPMESIGGTCFSRVIAIGMSSPFGVGNSAFRTQTGRTKLVDTVPFPAYTRKIIERAGYYDEELVRNQDDEYNYRIRELGGKILLADDVRSKYYTRSSLGSLWRQYYQYGYWKVRVLQKHPRQMSLRQFVPPLFVLSLFVGALSLLLPLPAFRLHPGYFIPILYLIVNFAASTYTAIKKGWFALPLLPLVFGILHFSYGVGFLVGLVKFSKRWSDKIGKVPIIQNRAG